MKKNKIIMYLIIAAILVVIFLIGYIVLFNAESKKENNDYIPESEITEEQLRQTVISLYFMNVEEENVESELRKIDVKNLLEKPYYIVLKMLIEGPENEKLIKVIPEGTKINNAYIDKGILYIDFSKEFIENQKLGEKQENLLIDTIVKTMKQFNEINNIKILIEGQENLGFPDSAITFNKMF